MKSKNFIISLVVYPLDVMVSLGQSDQELEECINENVSFYHEDYFTRQLKRGRSSLLPNGQSILRMRSYPVYNDDYGSLQHEIFHTVTNLFDMIGMKLTEDSDEAYAYLIGYLTTEIYNNL